ncbi:hypothetical protein ACTFIY_000417 [Dictyostelium cf. discoideum]
MMALREKFCKSTSSKLNIEKSVSMVLGNPDISKLKIPISNNPERYLVEWFLSASNYKISTGFNVINLMNTKRAQFSMSLGGWNIWNIHKRQKAQRLWMINQLMSDIEKQGSSLHSFSQKTSMNGTSGIKSANFKGLKAIKNSTNEPLSLSEWYDKINFKDPHIPKTEFQKNLLLRGYSYNQIFANILKIRDPKTRNTMFRFYSRCLPLNYLHNKICNMCNLNIDNIIQDTTLDYEIILKKWYKAASLDYINKIKNYKLSSSKETLSICNKAEYFKQIKKIKNQIISEYCIPNSALPNRVIVDQFI